MKLEIICYYRGMIKQQLLEDLTKAVENLGFPATDVVLYIPQNLGHGDLTTNIALQLSKQKSGNSRQSPMEIANKILSNLKNLNYLSDIEIKSPGFINLFIKPEFLSKDLEEILKLGENFGKSNKGFGKKARVEFVSANPTGPLHFGNARGGPIGDTISSVLEFSGWEVTREYLNNDRGNQVLELGKTLATRLGLLDIKEEDLSYKGGYTKELAVSIKPEIGDTKSLSEAEIATRVGEAGVRKMFDEIIKDCTDLGIEYDKIVMESDLQKEAPQVLVDLEKKGLLKKYEGAVWFAPKNEYLKDKDAVVVKSDGTYTYFASDIVYHKEKFESGYDLVVDVFGSNTSGHVPKLQALAKVLDFDLSKFQVILYQFVRVKRGDEVVKMSKRAGNFITAQEVLREVGKDAFRFFVLMHDPNTHMDFDLERAREKSSKNPVFYVQYAHARMSNILKKATGEQAAANYGLLIKKEELELIKHLGQLPDLIEEITQNYQVQHLTSYSITLADLFHKFYENCQVINAENEELKNARLALVTGAKIVLASVLGIMGIDAPEKM